MVLKPLLKRIRFCKHQHIYRKGSVFEKTLVFICNDCNSLEYDPMYELMYKTRKVTFRA